jgi:RNA polymerase primary sigma factor
LPRRIEDGFGQIQQLVLIGKERGYLLYDEINDSLPADVRSSQEIDDLLVRLGARGN